MHLWSIIAAAAMLVVAASAQTPGRESSTLVVPHKGVPVAVETVEEYVTKNPDGTSTPKAEKTKVYRDALSRMRTEIVSPNDDAFPGVLIDNRVDGFIAVLETSKKIAHRVRFPGGSSEFGISLGGGRDLRDVPGKKTQKTESLGKQSIEGIEFEGTRTTTTSDDQPSLVAVSEFWWATELGLMGLRKYSGPDEDSTARIEKLDRTPPDPALFVIPPDYHILDMETPGRP